MKLPILPAVGLLLLAGCIIPPATTTPELPAVATWHAPVAAAGPSVDDRPWGGLIVDPQLDTLIGEALANNAELRIAAARVELAQAQYRIQRADRLPSIAATGSFQRQSLPSALPGNFETLDTWSAGLAVPAWEVDLWGRVRSLSGAAEARFLSAEHNRRALRISLVAEVAAGYLNLVSLDQQVEIAAATLASREHSLALIVQRHDAGIASGLDRHQADLLVTGARRQHAELSRLRTRQENALAVLVGRPPGPVVRNAAVFAGALPPLLPAGLPADLVAHRPDLLAAAEGLRAADLDVDAARRTFLPTISLTGFAGFISPSFEKLFDDNTAAWNVQPSVALPLFQAGRLRGNLAANRAQQTIAAEQYVLAVRTAYREVEDTLTDHQSYVIQLNAATAGVAAARHRQQLTQMRYEEGISPYFEVLDASRDLFTTELELAQTRRAAYATIVQLYRVLGGAWEGKPAPAITDPAP